MPLADINAPVPAIQILRNALARNQAVSSYLFSGPLGAELEELAEGFVKALFCHELPDDFCGHCNVCRRISLDARKNTFADLTVVRPENNENSAEENSESSGNRIRPEPRKEGLIRIEQVRERIIEPSFRSPHESDRRVSVVVDAECLTPQAANALLKTLEEPPPQVYLILLTHHRERLLPTIRSRCQQVPVGLLGPGWVARVLAERHGMSAEQAQRIAAMSGGRLAVAEAICFYEDEELPARALELLQHAIHGRVPEVMKVCEQRTLVSRARLPGLLTVMERMLHDAMVVSSGGDSALLYYTDPEPRNALHDLFSPLPAATVAVMLECVWDAMRDVRHYGNSAIVLADLMVALANLAGGARAEP